MLEDCRTQPSQRKAENHQDANPDQDRGVPEIQCYRRERESRESERKQKCGEAHFKAKTRNSEADRGTRP